MDVGDIDFVVWLIFVLECKVGWIFVNGWLMGVEVVYVMVYGGLFLVMFDGCMMLVGSLVIDCFL